MGDWTVLRRVPTHDTATITLRVDGVLYLSVGLFRELEQPTSVQILVDAERRRLGVRAADAESAESFPVRPVKSNGQITRYFAGSRAAWERAGIPITPTKAAVATKDGDVWYITLAQGEPEGGEP